MPFLAKNFFSLYIQKNSKKNSSTLQVKKATDFCQKNKDYYCKSSGNFPDAKPYPIIFLREAKRLSLERASLSTHSLGSITVEAAIALPFFIFAISSIIFLFNVLYIQNTFQEQLSNIAKNLSNSAYLSSAILSLSEDEKSNLASTSNFYLSDLSGSIIDSAIVRNKFLNPSLYNFINSNYIRNGEDGISFSLTKYDSTNTSLEIVISYEFVLPFLPDFIRLPVTQICKIDLYDGCPITPAKNDHDPYVYICIDSNTYHTNKYCSYLLKYTSVHSINDSVSIGLPACSFCTYYYTSHKDVEPKYIYLTELGGCYHTTLECSVFTRSIYTVKLSSLNYTYNLCTRCEESIQ